MIIKVKINQDKLPQYLNKNLVPIYLLSSDEPLLLQESRDLIREQAYNQGFTEYLTFTGDKDFSAENFLAASHNLSLFSNKTLLELSAVGGKINSNIGKVLETYASQPAADKVLIILVGKLDSTAQRSRWFKAIEKIGLFVPIWPIDANRLPNWIAGCMRKLGLKTSSAGLRLLAEYSEGNLLAAKQEIEKLYLLYGANTLSEEQIIAAITDNARFNVFNLVDEILRGATTKAIRIIESLRQEKNEPTLVLWAVTKELRSLITMSRAMEQGQSIEQIIAAQRIWPKRQFLLKCALQKYAKAKLQRMLKHCAYIDSVIKGAESGNVWHELERLLLL